MYNNNIWVYTPCGEGKVELFKLVDEKMKTGGYKDRKDVRILVWGNGLTEHCALIKTIETLIERPNKRQHKFYYCNRPTFRFNSRIQYENHVLATLSNQRLFVLRKNLLIL